VETIEMAAETIEMAVETIETAVADTTEMIILRICT
jgi:hypothetical protein